MYLQDLRISAPRRSGLFSDAFACPGFSPAHSLRCAGFQLNISPSTHTCVHQNNNSTRTNRVMSQKNARLIGQQSSYLRSSYIFKRIQKTNTRSKFEKCTYGVSLPASTHPHTRSLCVCVSVCAECTATLGQYSTMHSEACTRRSQRQSGQKNTSKVQKTR